MCDHLMKSQSSDIKIENWLFGLPICVFLLKEKDTTTSSEVILWDNWKLQDYKAYLSPAKTKVKSGYR